MKKLRPDILPFTLFLVLNSNSLAQQKAAEDSARVVILSDRVGKVISSADREKYHVFSQFEDFRNAVVLQLPDSSCAVRITLESAGRERDTLVRYSWGSIMMMADRVEHFEELEIGEYVMGSSPIRLRYAPTGLTGSTEFVPPGAAFIVPSVLSWKGTNATGRDSIKLPWPILMTHRADDALPLASAPDLTMPRRYPCLAVAIGFRTFAPDFSGLNGGSLSSNGASIPFLFNIIPELLITRDIGIQIDWAHNGAEYNTTGATLVLYTHVFDNPNVCLFLEAGGVWTYVHTTLEGTGDPQIYMQTAGGGVRAGIGVEYQVANSVAIVLDVSYEHIARESGVFDDWYLGGHTVTPISVDLSSFRVGIRLKIG